MYDPDEDYELPADLPEADYADLGDYDPQASAIEAAEAESFADWKREFFDFYPAVTALTVGTRLHEDSDGLRASLTAYFTVEFEDGRTYPGSDFTDEEAERMGLGGLEQDLDVFDEEARTFMLALPSDDSTRWLRNGTLAPNRGLS